jgi:hypothetical protein
MTITRIGVSPHLAEQEPGPPFYRLVEQDRRKSTRTRLPIRHSLFDDVRK